MEPLQFPQEKKLKLVDRYFASLHTLKTSDAFFLKSLLLVSFIFLTLFLIHISEKNTVAVATAGGTFTEGIVGTPRFVNPILAVSRADKDLSTLIYDGLMMLGKDGELVPNVAESVTISEDGLTYNVILKQSIAFSDGTALTAHDVAFTVSRIQEPSLASPLRASFDGVTVEEIGDYELNFVLTEPYAPFIENLTFGILPSHIWKDAANDEFPFSKYNSEPIGSGPYVIDKIIRNASGIPETYTLKANTAYHIQTPKIDTLELHFFPTEDKLIQAFNKGTIGSVVGIDQEKVKNLVLDLHHLERIPLPRTIAVFFNQNKSAVLRDDAVRKALDTVVDRQALIDQTLGGYGNPLTSPIPLGFGITEEMSASTEATDTMSVAADLLKAGGWKRNAETQVWEKTIDGTLTPLAFNLTTVNNGTLEATAEFLKNTWEQLGAQVTIKQFEQSDLTQTVIRPRDFEALLFGTQLGRALDFYSFWHSSQKNDPGLNIALYANITTDSILSEMRRNSDKTKRTEATNLFATELKKETPAIFLYAPELLYVFPDNVKNATFTGVSEPYERFSGVYDWYIKTESVWPLFTK